MTLLTSWVSENNSCFLPIKLPGIPEEEMFIPAGEIIWCRYGLLLASGDRKLHGRGGIWVEPGGWERTLNPIEEKSLGHGSQTVCEEPLGAAAGRSTVGYFKYWKETQWHLTCVGRCGNYWLEVVCSLAIRLCYICFYDSMFGKLSFQQLIGLRNNSWQAVWKRSPKSTSEASNQMWWSPKSEKLQVSLVRSG